VDQLKRSIMKRQTGVTVSGFILWAIVGIFALLLGFKIGPPYLENFAIEKQFKVVASDPDLRAGMRREVEAAYSRRAVIENLRSVSPSDLKIAKEGDRIVISAEYSVRVPLVGNLSACMDFYPSSRN